MGGEVTIVYHLNHFCASGCELRITASESWRNRQLSLCQARQGCISFRRRHAAATAVLSGMAAAGGRTGGAGRAGGNDGGGECAGGGVRRVLLVQEKNRMSWTEADAVALAAHRQLVLPLADIH